MSEVGHESTFLLEFFSNVSHTIIPFLQQYIMQLLSSTQSMLIPYLVEAGQEMKQKLCFLN